MRQEYEQVLLAQLKEKNNVTLQSAMQTLNISESTARRLFTRLENDGFCIRTHGAIQRLSYPHNFRAIDKTEQINVDNKMLIARKACELLEDEDIVYLDSGSTIRCFCTELIKAVEENNYTIKVFTNSLANLEILAPTIPVTVLGGEYRKSKRDLHGFVAEHTLKKLFFSKCFIEADGFVYPDTFTSVDYQSASLDEIVVNHSERAYLLFDSSKFEHTSHITHVSASDLNAVITNQPVPEGIEAAFSKQNCELIIAE